MGCGLQNKAWNARWKNRKWAEKVKIFARGTREVKEKE